MKQISYRLVVFVAMMAAIGCSKKETPKSNDTAIVNGARNVVEATTDVMRDLVEGVNDAVYGSRK